MRYFLLILLALMLSPALAHAGPFEDANTAAGRQDYATAVKILQPLADQGNTEAMVRMGFLYWGGLYRSDQAMKWFKEAANLGNTSAQSMVGQMYWEGQGVEKNSAEAAKWYRMAAERGDQNAERILAVLYAKDDEPNYAESYKWLVIASGGNPHIKESRELEAHLAEHLSVSQIKEAKSLAAKWMVKYYSKRKAPKPCVKQKNLEWNSDQIASLKMEGNDLDYSIQYEFFRDHTVTISRGPMIGPIVPDTYQWNLVDGDIQLLQGGEIKDLLIKESETDGRVTICHLLGYRDQFSVVHNSATASTHH